LRRSRSAGISCRAAGLDALVAIHIGVCLPRIYRCSRGGRTSCTDLRCRECAEREDSDKTDPVFLHFMFLHVGYLFDCPAGGMTAAGVASGVLLAADVLLACTGAADTTSYSRSLSSPSGTFNTMKSFFMRNMAFSPTGRSAGCFSSLGRIR